MSARSARVLSGVAIAALLAACSGGGGGGGSPDSYGDYVSLNTDLKRQLEYLPQTSPSNLPTTGTAAYEGAAGFIIGVSPSDSIQYFGAIDLTVGFAGAGDVSGRISDVYSNGNVFSGEDAGPVSGTLTIGNGRVERVEPGPGINPNIYADVDGTLTHGDITQVVEGRLNGQFLGTDPDYVSGNLNTRDPQPFDPVFSGSFNAQGVE